MHAIFPPPALQGRLLGGLILALALLVATLNTHGMQAQAADRYGKQKVVYHINYNGGENNKRYRGALRNIQNHINAVGADNLDLKVVLHGNGVNLLKEALKDDGLKTRITSLKSQNVAFLVCANTLRGRKIDYEKDLFDVFREDIVPSGVAELARLQLMGHAYIKP